MVCGVRLLETAGTTHIPTFFESTFYISCNFVWFQVLDDTVLYMLSRWSGRTAQEDMHIFSNTGSWSIYPYTCFVLNFLT